MRRLLRIAPVLALLASAPAWATDTYVGTITSTGASVTNLTTATPFQLGGRWKISIQCDADAYVAEGPSYSPPTVTASNGLRVLANNLFDIDLTDQKNLGAYTFAVGVISVSGTVNCKVFVSSYN